MPFVQILPASSYCQSRPAQATQTCTTSGGPPGPPCSYPERRWAEIPGLQPQRNYLWAFGELSFFYFRASSSQFAPFRPQALLDEHLTCRMEYRPSGIWTWNNNVTVGLYDQRAHFDREIQCRLLVKSRVDRSSRLHYRMHTPHRSYPIMCFSSKIFRHNNDEEATA